MSQFAGYIFIILPILLIGVIIYRFNRKQVKRVLSGQKTLEDSEVWLRNSSPLPAIVIKKNETISPDAHGIAKVDLDLQIQLSYGNPVDAKTSWLVEIPSLPQLEPGQSVLVKFDPKKPNRVFPAVPWARAWLFDR
jgi:hypothetical protein